LKREGDSLTAKDYLEDIRRTSEKLISVTYDIEEVRAQKYSLQSTNFSEKVQSSVIYKNQLDNLMEREKELLKKRGEISDKWWECRALINKIQNPKLVDVLSYYYLRNTRKYKDGERVSLTWDDVAEKMSTSVRTVNRLHGRALQVFRKISKME
jgi:hypothetical protein